MSRQLITAAKNVETTRRFAEDFNYKNIDVQEGSLSDLPYDDQSFDFIWCNGVIMHTEKPNDCLAELARVLRVGGQIWIYVYGAGGVYWRVIYHLREMVKGIDIETCMSALNLFRYETRYIAEFIDDWYATWLRTYTHDDMSVRLSELGFQVTAPLPYGMDYDTSHRLNSISSLEERQLMRTGDLRYLLSKKTHKQEHRQLLDEGEYGSQYPYPEFIKDQIDPLMDSVLNVGGEHALMKIALAAHIQRELRIMLYKKGAFPLTAFRELIDNLVTIAQKVHL